MSLHTLFEAGADGGKEDSSSVDIVAIHGLDDASEATWTAPKSGVNWLRVLLPLGITATFRPRVLLYAYTSDSSILFENDAAGSVLQHAHTLVSKLQAERSLSRSSKRPLLFVCHGFGGLIVKRALAFSASQVSQKVVHNYSIYISTFGIIFLGTPHSGFEPDYLKSIARRRDKVFQMEALMARQHEIVQTIADQFAPLMKQFHIYFFWEEIPTRFKHTLGFVVSKDSAAPMLDNTERAGCWATHSQMIKFEDSTSSEYKTIVEALIRYAEAAQASIIGRWQNATKFIRTQRSIEASELVGFDVHNNNSPFMYLNSPKTPQRSYSGLTNKHFYVPHNVSDIFTGQARLQVELQQKMFKLEGVSTPPRRRVFVLYGLGGSGKTQFCLKFIQDHRDRFWAVFWVDASSVETAERALALIGKVGGIGDNHQAGIHWLSGLQLPWMLVIDNADDRSIDYSQFFPGGDRGHILLTTRIHDCTVYATVGSHEFRNMDTEDAIALLLRAAGLDRRAKVLQQTAALVVKALGYLPLAVTQAGACIRQNICSLEEYIPLYESHKEELLKRRIVQNSESHHQSVFTTFDVTFRSIERETSQAAADALEIFQVLGFLHFEQAPVDLFERAWQNMCRWPESLPAQSFTATIFERFQLLLGPATSHFLDSFKPNPRWPSMVSERQVRWNLYRFREALGVLTNHSLLYRDAGGEDTYSIHPLVQSWARDRLSPKDQRLWLDIATNVLAASMTEDLAATDKTYRASLVPHVNACLKHKSAITLAEGRLNSYQMSKSIKFAAAYSDGGQWKDAVRLQQCIIGAAKSHPQLSSPRILDVMMSLADSHWNLDEVAKSIKLLSGIVESCKAMVGSEDPKTLRAQDKLAGALWLVGQRPKARLLSEAAVHKLKAILGPSHPWTLDAMDTLGRTLLHLGHANQAEELHKAVLEGRSKYLGPIHLDTLTTMGNLGMAYFAKRRLHEAEQLLTVVLQERSHILGAEHAYTLWAVNDLAKIRCERGQAFEAEEMLTDILEPVSRTLGDDHIGMLMTKQNLARAYSAQEHWKDSRRVMLELLAIHEKKMIPMEHPDRIAADMELARVTRHLGDLDTAERMFISVIEKCKKVHGIKDQRTARAMGQLSAVYIAMGKVAEAEAVDQEIDQKSGLPLGP